MKVWLKHILCFLACASWQLSGIGIVWSWNMGVGPLWTNWQGPTCKSDV
ncbi:hypothetical protein Goklo_015947, partial [Gossypium klotzschianum]|nr:hypothetical protein [Gossypium klotzschianum]